MPGGLAYGEGVRIRAVLATAATALLLAACGSQSGPASGQDDGSTPQSAVAHNLSVEVDAQMRDPCFRKPTEMAAPDCQKYITQLASTPEAAKKVARDNPALAEAAKHLREGIDAYRADSCTSPAEEQQACTRALVTIADALRQVERALDKG